MLMIIRFRMTQGRFHPPTRDDEFTEALRKALPAAELEGWFEVFTAARERAKGRNG